jgi:hypothetical protein
MSGEGLMSEPMMQNELVEKVRDAIVDASGCDWDDVFAEKLSRAAIEAHDSAMGEIRAAVDQYQNAPYRSADWLANEIMNILGVIANDAHPISKGE